MSTHTPAPVAPDEASKWALPDSTAGLEGYATMFRRCDTCRKTMATVDPNRPICMACAKAKP